MKLTWLLFSAQGIQTLLDAEKEASKIVTKARECERTLGENTVGQVGTDSYRLDRTQRVKDARGEASKEIEELKAKKEAEFKEFESEVS